jgi:ribosome-binding protein aMBF1 (putative translation factor)
VPPTILGQHIQKRRLELGLGRKRFARMVGVSLNVIHSLEKRGATPSQGSYQKLVAFLGYDPGKQVGK